MVVFLLCDCKDSVVFKEHGETRGMEGGKGERTLWLNEG